MKATLLLEDGTIFNAKAAGSPSETIGEIVFNTAMTGYEEILSDPSYAGQIITFTTAHIGNTGITIDDQESKQIYAQAMICKTYSHYIDNFRAKLPLHEWLEQNKKVLIYDIDTRYLTQKLSKSGCVNGIISTEDHNIESLKKKLNGYVGIQNINTVEEYTVNYNRPIDNVGAKYKLAVYDFGIKQGIVDQLINSDCELHYFDYTATANEISAINPDGIFLSNGSGDPKQLASTVEQIKELIPKFPVFGICLGHQLICLALGGNTFKLPYGHHAANHPVFDQYYNKKVEITSQNHNYAVDIDLIKKDIEITHIHLNDKTISGIRHQSLPCFSVQYHPESNPGPHDSHYLFNEFIKTINLKRIA